MKTRLLYVAALIVFILFSVPTVTDAQSVKFSKRPKNIILLIGDGMGPSQVTAGLTLSDNTFVLKKFKYAGYCTTFSYDRYVTDSAAAGTAIACGVKTKNGMLGMTPDSIPVPSIMEIAKKNGIATGLVSTSAVTHATPASFISKNAGRGNYEEIALDFMSGKIDVFIGGGSDHFNKRKDGRDLTSDLTRMGYDVVYTLNDLKLSGSNKIAGLLDKEHMARSVDGRYGMLAEMTAKAIEALSRSDKGFILMVEGSQIDFAGHEGNLEWNISEVLDFNDAVSVAYEFADRTGNTLVVVTADHETGGLALTGGSLEKKSVQGIYPTGNHTAVIVPVFSYGPGAEKFTGILDNTDFFPAFKTLLKLK